MSIVISIGFAHLGFLNLLLAFMYEVNIKKQHLVGTAALLLLEIQPIKSHSNISKELESSANCSVSVCSSLQLGGEWKVEIIPRPGSIESWNIIATRIGG